MVAALLAERAGARFKAQRSGNDVAEGRLADVPVTLARPRSDMNLSGGPVAGLAQHVRVPALSSQLDQPPARLLGQVAGERVIVGGQPDGSSW